MAASSSAGDVVVDGFNDIAKRQNLDSVMVEAPGRERFQQAKLFLEVGLAYADDPKMGLPKGASGNKARSTKKKDKQPGRRRDVRMMRVFTPVTDYLQEQNKFYGGCLPMNGRLHHYLITADCVFFYPEFYEDVAVDIPQKDFGKAILRNTRIAAAINKTTQRPTTAIITPDELSKKLTAHPLVVTQSEHLASSLRLQWDLYRQTQDTAHVKAMMASLEKAHTDLKYGPDTSTDGITNFMDFDEPLADDKAEVLCHEIKSNYPHMNPDVMLIKMIHAQLRKPHQKSTDGQPLGNRLTVSGFGFFMELMHKEMLHQDNDGAGEYSEPNVDFQINEALDKTEIFMHHSKCSWTPSNLVPQDGGEIEVEDLFHVLTSMRDVVRAVIRFSEASMEDVAKQHGGMLKSTSLKDLMIKVADSVDRASLQARFEQICALHAAAYAQNKVNSAKTLQNLAVCMDKVLLMTEKSLGEEGGQ
ncbi:hypothetical protein UCDDA912_g10654 [Diaporthe ampelina]|uniref:Uncharacterized protein n=1 Tax=Diaporthe ampelina TaxID=1214573 RepID=A0A0G2F3U0_9PEZI|nr:hypothetical protein UCDDA912_g10654 [Diaporthe ampelina]